MRKKRKVIDTSSLDETLINLTPLIDVVFVVLVAFILIAPLLEVDNVTLASSGESSQRDFSGRGLICIYVREDNSILLHHRLVTFSELRTLLKEAYEKNPKEIPQIFHDRNASFGTYQSIKNIVEEVGFEQMHVFLKSYS